MHHDRMNHVIIDRNFIKREIREEGIKLTYISSIIQKANILTKTMLKLGFKSLIGKLGMTDIYSPVWGGSVGIYDVFQV